MNSVISYSLFLLKIFSTSFSFSRQIIVDGFIVVSNHSKTDDNGISSLSFFCRLDDGTMGLVIMPKACSKQTDYQFWLNTFAASTRRRHSTAEGALKKIVQPVPVIFTSIKQHEVVPATLPANKEVRATCHFLSFAYMTHLYQLLLHGMSYSPCQRKDLCYEELT